jgi:hypothetical protein
MPKLFAALFGLVVSGCASSTEPRLNYEGRFAIAATAPTIVDAAVTIRNTGSATANISTPPCPLGIAVYPTPDRSGKPLWLSEPRSCVWDLMIYPPIAIAPGDFYEFTARAIIPTTFTGQRVYLAMSVPGSVKPVPVGQLIVK